MDKKINEKRNGILDVLKGICILFIVITHYSWSDEQRLKLLFPYWIDMAVPIFMIISGYVNALSFNKKGIDTYSKAYAIRTVCSKMIRYTVPFAIAYFIMYFDDLFLEQSISLFDGFLYFLWGGDGPGGYYYPILIQFIFLFPFIYFIVKKYDLMGVVLCGGMNLIYEVLQCAYGMNAGLYRVLIFRYIFIIAFGGWLYMKKRKAKTVIGIISFLLGMFFIFLSEYTNYEPQIIVHWTRTSFIACLFIIPIANILIENCRIRCKILEVMGRASYNIFLVQMVYYSSLSWHVYQRISSRFVELLVSVMICIVGGIVFYLIESHITGFILKVTNDSMDKVNFEELMNKANEYLTK